ncbi:hypothetical protein BH10PLA1_BH10PLA1_11680 [soil metagenome]
MTQVSQNVSEEDLEHLTALFRLLSDRTRLNIVLLLAQGERNVTSLCEELRLPQPTVSHHLGLLRTSNLVTNRRMGKQVFYALPAEAKAKISDETARVPLGLGAGRFMVRIADPAFEVNSVEA